MSDYPNIPGHTIKKCIGKGGMGEVYLGVQHSLGRSVALKVTLASLAEHDSNFADRFVREAKTTGRLRHPNIITVYDTGEVGDRCYMTMEYIEGGSLKEKIKEASLDHEQILAIAKGVCAGLGHAHKAGFVHRDIKPENILLTVDGIPVVMDFGIVKVLQSDIDLTGTHAVGSPKYMSPEQLMGDSLIDGRADLYSLGVVLFEMLEGKPPFDAEAAYAVGIKHLNDVPPDLSLANHRFQQLISCLLEKDRDDRYRNAGDLLKAFNRLDVEEVGEGFGNPPTRRPFAPVIEAAARSDNDATGLRAPRQIPQTQSPAAPRRPNLHDASNPGLRGVGATALHKSNLRKEHQSFVAAGRIDRGPNLFGWLFSFRAFAILVIIGGFVAFPIFWPDITLKTLSLEANAYFGSPVQQFRIAMDLAERNNVERSRFWLSRASDGGVAGAGYELGLSYRYSDERKAAAAWQSELDNMTHDTYDREASLKLGRILCNGRDYEDCSRAVQVLGSLVQENGSQKAMYLLGEIYYSRWQPPDYAQALTWFERTIEIDDGGPPTSQDSEAAMLMIANMYDEGLGLTQSVKLATNWLVKAAQGSASRRSTRDNAKKRCADASLRARACDGLK
jgi:serine/threonine protein kinase